MNKWQSLDSAPKDGRFILISYKTELNKTRVSKVLWINSDEIEEFEDPSGYAEGFYEWPEDSDIAYPILRNPTHWRPLPEPPKEEACEK